MVTGLVFGPKRRISRYFGPFSICKCATRYLITLTNAEILRWPVHQLNVVEFDSWPDQPCRAVLPSLQKLGTVHCQHGLSDSSHSLVAFINHGFPSAAPSGVYPAGLRCRGHKQLKSASVLEMRKHDHYRNLGGWFGQQPELQALQASAGLGCPICSLLLNSLEPEADRQSGDTLSETGGSIRLVFDYLARPPFGRGPKDYSELIRVETKGFRGYLRVYSHP